MFPSHIETLNSRASKKRLGLLQYETKCQNVSRKAKMFSCNVELQLFRQWSYDMEIKPQHRVWGRNEMT